MLKDYGKNADCGKERCPFEERELFSIFVFIALYTKILLLGLFIIV